MDYATKQTIMATIINNPGNTEGGGSAAVVIVGVIALLMAIGAFVFYGLPAMRSGAAQPQENTLDVNVKLPEPAQPSAAAGPAEPSAPAPVAEPAP